MTLTRKSVATFSALLLFASCGDDDTASTTTTTKGEEPTTTAAAADADYEVELTSQPCTWTDNLSAEIECGTVAVPLDRDDLDAGTIDLEVAVIRSAGEASAPTLLRAGGGPGIPSLLEGTVTAMAPFAEDRDVVLFDYRGIGREAQDLNCPEIDEVIVANYSLADQEAELSATAAAAETCRTRLESEGVDLDHFTVPAEAADVVDIARALALDEWDLYALSHGSQVAWAVLAGDHPGLRAVVVDSPVAADYVGATTAAETNLAGLERFFAACAADEACAETYPDLRGDWDRAVALLEEQPFAGEVDLDGAPVPIRIDHHDAWNGLVFAVRQSALIPTLPSIVRSLGEGDHGIVPALAQQAIVSEVSVVDAQSAAMHCSATGAFPAHASAEPVEPFGLVDGCDPWEVEPVAADALEPAETDIPVLLVHGGLDPLITPEQVGAIATALGYATAVELGALGHDIVTDPCAQSIMEAFLAEPGGEPDTACAEALASPAWATG